jgi:hypothetical protein
MHTLKRIVYNCLTKGQNLQFLFSAGSACGAVAAVQGCYIYNFVSSQTEYLSSKIEYLSLFTTCNNLNFAKQFIKQSISSLIILKFSK